MVLRVRIRAVQCDEARHQERQKKHARDRLKQCHQPGLGRDGSDIPIADRGVVYLYAADNSIGLSIGYNPSVSSPSEGDLP